MMKSTRRQFLGKSSVGAGAVLLSPMLDQFAVAADGSPDRDLPQRFVFVMKSSAIIPGKLEPKTLKDKLADKSNVVNEPLAGHELPPTLAPLEPYKDQLPFQACPDIAFEQLFGSAVSEDERSKMRCGLRIDRVDARPVVKDYGYGL